MAALIGSRDGESEWIHSVLHALRAGIRETIVVRDGLEHIKPNGAFFALEMAWLKPDTIQ